MADSFFCTGFDVNSVLLGDIAQYLQGCYNQSMIVCLTQVVLEFPSAVAAHSRFFSMLKRSDNSEWMLFFWVVLWL